MGFSINNKNIFFLLLTCQKLKRSFGQYKFQDKKESIPRAISTEF
jgi:hypothetical protein